MESDSKDIWKVLRDLAKQNELRDQQIKLLGKQNDIQQDLIESLLARVVRLENERNM